MKTKVSLSILGVYNALMGIIILIFASAFSSQVVNSDNADVVRMGELFHYGLSPALLIIGLMLLLARNCSIETAKKLLLGYIIGTLLLMYIFFGIMANETLMNFSIESAVPDIIMLILSIFGYVKAK
ncbi:MAG: hypothetical protein CL844_08590 [Crocinitomicaceae bacterium]|nr:hypothetical protein [Crocinitomicaceae bacterium]|tara:strand:- start:4067 stop:4447 length:381 start_codon:yes stop_codon:yes gene_type:complete